MNKVGSLFVPQSIVEELLRDRKKRADDAESEGAKKLVEYSRDMRSYVMGCPQAPAPFMALLNTQTKYTDLDCRKIRLGGGGDERWCVIQWAPPSATYQGDERLPFVLIVIRGAAGVYEDPSPKWFNKLMAGHRDDPRKMMIAMTEAKAAADIAWEKEADDMLEAPVEEATRAYANLTQDYKLKHIQVSVPGEREG